MSTGRAVGAYVWMIASRTMPEFHRSGPGLPMSRTTTPGSVYRSTWWSHLLIQTQKFGATSSLTSCLSPCASAVHTCAQKYMTIFFLLPGHRCIIDSSSFYHATGTHIDKSKVVFRTGPVSRAMLSCQSTTTMRRSGSTEGLVWHMSWVECPRTRQSRCHAAHASQLDCRAREQTFAGRGGP